MILVFENISEYNDAMYFVHLKSLPEWRREYVLKYKKADDRKRAVLAYVLLREAAERRFGVGEIPDFSYNEFGKPYFENKCFYFSISHSRSKVVCGVYESEIGVDIQDISPYNEKVAKRLGMEITEKEKDSCFTRLWTAKEAISKFEGKGLNLPFSSIDADKYLLFTKEEKGSVLTVCYGKKSEKRVLPKIEYIKADEL